MDCWIFIRVYTDLKRTQDMADEQDSPNFDLQQGSYPREGASALYWG